MTPALYIRKGVVLIAVLFFCTFLNFDFLKDTPASARPDESSELARLMRDMEHHVIKARSAVLKNKKLKRYPAAFEKIYSATPTAPTMKHETFNGFASYYLSALRDYSESNKENLKENYNMLVAACAACHTTHCPGPLSLIEKLPVE